MFISPAGTAHPAGLAHTAAIPFRRLLIVRISLYVPDKPLFFTQLLEASHHLLH
jgi:hypothetical protein